MLFICGSGGVVGQLLDQPVDVSKHPDVADQAVRKCEHRSTRVFESLTGRCQPEHLPLVGTGVPEMGKRLVRFGDGGENFVVEVGSECLDVIDVFTELVESDLGLPERTTKVDLRVEDVTEDGLVEPVPQVLVEAVDQLELPIGIHPINPGNAIGPQVPLFAGRGLSSRVWFLR